MVSWFSALMMGLYSRLTPILPGLSAVFGQQVARFKALGEGKVAGAIAGEQHVRGVLHDGPCHPNGVFDVLEEAHAAGIPFGVHHAGVQGHLATAVGSSTQTDTGAGRVALDHGRAFDHGVQRRPPFFICRQPSALETKPWFQVASMWPPVNRSPGFRDAAAGGGVAEGAGWGRVRAPQPWQRPGGERCGGEHGPS